MLKIVLNTITPNPYQMLTDDCYCILTIHMEIVKWFLKNELFWKTGLTFLYNCFKYWDTCR
jgi:hypothetical protein